MAEPIRAILRAWRNTAGQAAADASIISNHHAELEIPEAARDILAAIIDPILLLEAEGRIVFANRASELLIRPAAAGKHLSAVLRTPELLEAIDRVQSGGGAATVAFTLPVPVERHLEAFIARIPPSLIVIRFRDISQMQRTEQLRADFIANASHELRTPLASLTGFIDTLRGHAKDDPEARELFLKIMSAEASRMRRLIDDLLSLTKIELNEHNPPSGNVDVVGVVRDAADALQVLADSEGMKIEVAEHDALGVAGERDELTQVFQNLIHNAIKYGRKGSRVEIRFGQADSPAGGNPQIFVAVQDEGEGIPREKIPRLTERFYRVDINRSRERGGTGLGLAIVKHILNRHRGRLDIQSTPGVGSTFTVWVPAAPAP